MILQLVVACLLFALGSGNILEFIPGQYPDEPKILDGAPPISEMYIPVWAEAVKELASDETRVKFLFRFFNRPSQYRYILDIILLLGNLDIPDEGFGPYVKRENGLAALQPLINEMKRLTKSSAGQPSEEVSKASHFQKDDIESTDSSIQDTVYLPVQDGVAEVSQSTAYETEALESTARDFEEETRAFQSVEPTTESPEHVSEPTVVASKVTPHEVQYLVQEFVETSSSEEDSGEFKRRSGLSHGRHPPHGYRVHYPEHHGSEHSSEEEESEEFEHRVGVPHPSDSVAVDSEEDNSEESTEEECDEDGIPLKYEHVYQPSEPIQAGSIRGIPGVHFPDYTDIPITSFSCAGRPLGFYADLETGCQVFHVCLPRGAMESFLCPTGTIFNQPILACDYYYSANCSISHLFFDVNTHFQEPETSTEEDGQVEATDEPIIATSPRPITIILPPEQPTQRPAPLPVIDWTQLLEFLPAKSKVVARPQSAPRATVNLLKKPKSVVHVKKSKLVPKRKLKVARKVVASQIMREVLEAAENMARNAQPLLPRVTSIGHLPLKSVHSTKKPVKLVQNPASTPRVVQRFVVKPASFKRPRVVIRKQSRIGETVPVEESSAAQVIRPVKVYRIESVSEPVRDDVPETVLSALEMAGTVLNRDILPFTRQALMENYVKHAKVKQL